jgi:hypothetical protein
MTTKIQAIIDYRTKVGDRIDRKCGAFTNRANLLHEKNLERMYKEIKEVKK